MHRERSRLLSKPSIAVIVAAMFFGVIALTVYPPRLVLSPDQAARMAAEHNIPARCITRILRPIDCDWLTAPLGNKGCAYEKRVEFNANNLSESCPAVVLEKWERH